MTTRTSTIERKTNETQVRVALNMDGAGSAAVQTGIGFLDHLLSTLAFHARFDLDLQCIGDLQIDDHHTAEDCAIGLGQAIDAALASREAITRFGYAYAPLDEALSRAVVDVSGRSGCVVKLDLRRDRVGELSCENIPHIFQSLARSARCTIHVDVIRGENDHHRAESAMKAFALALRQAVSRSASAGIPSTKGTLQ